MWKKKQKRWENDPRGRRLNRKIGPKNRGGTTKSAIQNEAGFIPDEKNRATRKRPIIRRGKSNEKM